MWYHAVGLGGHRLHVPVGFGLLVPFLLWSSRLYLLYVDESGQHGGQYFVLAGVAVFERQTYWLGNTMDQIQRRYLPLLQEPAPFHASEIRAGAHDPWKGLPCSERQEILDGVYTLISDSRRTVLQAGEEVRRRGRRDPWTRPLLCRLSAVSVSRLP